jgi:oligopeptide transport system substrate-binding protein
MRVKGAKGWACTILGVILTLHLAGCQSSLGSSTHAPVATTASVGSELQEISLNLGDDPPQLDSALATDVISFKILGQVGEGLVRYGEGGRIEKGSGQAADWVVSDDGLTYTFKLKDGLRWSDGRPVTADDFKFAWLRVLDPKVGSSYNYQLFYIRGASAWSKLDMGSPDFDQQYRALREQVGIQVLDAQTLQVQLEHPTPYFLSLLGTPTYFPQRQDLVQKYGPRYATEADTLVSNGPFQIAEWNRGRNIIMVKNPYYWDHKQVRLTRIEWKMVENSVTAINLFEAGELDLVGLPGNQASQYEGRPGFHREAVSQTIYLAFNLDNQSKKYLQNVHLRRAISLALDRREFVQAIVRDGAIPATGLVPPTIAGLNGQAYRATVGDLLQSHADISAARQELALAMQELNLLDLPPIELLVDQSDVAKKYAQGLQAMVEQNLPGVSFTVTQVEWGVLLDRQNKGLFDVTLVGWIADYNDPMTFMDLFVSGAPYNHPRWTNKQYDRYIQDAAINADPAKRMQDFAAAEKILMDELPIIPLYMPAQSSIRKPWLKGVLHFSVGGPFDLKWAYVEGKAS